jgi:hypothetical protein
MKKEIEPLFEKCISLFGTGGFSKSVEEEEIDFHYTGFRLTKDQCGDKFMTESFNLEEKKEDIIYEILMKYSGVEW